MSENLATVQKTYEAIAGKSDVNTWNTEPGVSFFKTEFERQSYLSQLTPKDVQAAIIWLEAPENANVQNANIMRDFLKNKQCVMTQVQVEITQVTTQTKTSELAKDVALNSTESKDMSRKILELRSLFERNINEPMDEIKLAYVLDKLPLNDPLARSFMIRGLIGKLRSDGYDVTISSNGISVEAIDPKNNILAGNFLNLLNSKTQKADIEEALIIGSGSLSEFKRDCKGDITKAANKEYIKYVMDKYTLTPATTIQDIQNNPGITPAEKSLLVSAFSNGIIADAPLNPSIISYESTKKSMEELLSSPGFKQTEKLVVQVTGEKIPPPTNTPVLVKQIVENPSILSGKPITTIAAGLAIVMGLGYEGKGKGFSFWTGLKRGFMGLIALFLGSAVAKEWGMDPKKLLGEGVDLIKEGSKKTVEVAEEAKNKITGDTANETPKPLVKSDEKLAEKIVLTHGQIEATKVVNGHKILSDSIARHSESHRGQPGNGTLDQYLSFINSPEFQGQKLKNIIYTTDLESSIFNEKTGKLELGVTIPVELDHKILKKVLRTYLTGNPDINYVEGNKGKKEQETWEAKISVIKDQKEMTIADCLSKIYIS